MGLDALNLFLSGLILFIYGAIFVICAIFTFSLETYHKLNEKLKLDIISTRVLTPLERNVTVIDDWLMEHNKVIGPILTILSLFDMKSLFSLVNQI